jgi:hypothetical protein
MPETTTEVRADIEQTRARMSGAIAELEQKVDVAQKVKNNPWASLAVAFGTGVALSASRVDVKAAKATTTATRDTGTKLGGAVDGVLAALIAGVAEAFHSRIDGMVNDVVSSIRGTSEPPRGTSDSRSDAPVRAD